MRKIMRYSWIILYVPLVVLFSIRLREILVSIRGNGWLAALLLLCVLSAAWSISPGDSLRRSLGLLMTATLAYYVAASFPPLSHLRMLAAALTSATVLGLAAGLLTPEVGVMSVLHPGAWRGVFVNKNVFGGIAALNGVVVLMLLLLERGHRLWLAPALVVSLAALVLSESVTSMVTTVGVAIILGVAMVGRRCHAVGRMVLASVLIALGLLLVSSADVVLTWIGRDSTLTGRTLIWQTTWQMIGERPLLGYGYGAFWVEGSEPAVLLQEAVGWPIPTAHSGYLDLLLQLGAVGLILFALSVSTALLRTLGRSRPSEPALMLTCCGSIAFVLVYNLAESSMLEQHHLLTFVYVWAVAAARNEDLVVRTDSLRAIA